MPCRWGHDKGNLQKSKTFKFEEEKSKKRGKKKPRKFLLPRLIGMRERKIPGIRKE